MLAMNGAIKFDNKHSLSKNHKERKRLGSGPDREMVGSGVARSHLQLEQIILVMLTQSLFLEKMEM